MQLQAHGNIAHKVIAKFQTLLCVSFKLNDFRDAAVATLHEPAAGALVLMTPS